MSKIAFYLQTNTDKDCSNIESSNPGLGGTEYLFILIPLLLTKYGRHDIVLCTNFKGILPQNLNKVQCETQNDFVNYAVKNRIDYCVINYTSHDKSIIRQYGNVKFIIWSHNFIIWKDMDFFSSMSNVVKIIAVGKEQMDLYIDHKLYLKSCFIYNTVPIEYYEHLYNNSSNLERKNSIVYIGSICRAKGFHYLAQIWKDILKNCNDAQLYVIGRGNLYDKDSQLGKYGIAEADYEEQFMPYLTDEKGNILSSVHFMGVMGDEKFSILSKCKIGVPNPSGITETFGLTAVEMQAMGCRVVTCNCPGYLDTVYDKKMLYNHPSQLKKYILSSLDYETLSKDEMLNVYRFFSDNFSYSSVVREWNSLFDNVEKYKGGATKATNYLYRLKWLKFFVSSLKRKKIIPWKFYPVDRVLSQFIGSYY